MSSKALTRAIKWLLWELVLAAILVIAFWLALNFLPVPPVSGLDRIEVIATAYTCDPHPNNPMTSHPDMCKVTRWGGSNVGSPGMACPVSWRLSAWHVPGYGRLVCDDTMRADLETYRGLPHIDLRVQSYEEALWVNRNGGEVVVIERAEEREEVLREQAEPPEREVIRRRCNEPEWAIPPALFVLAALSCNMDS